MSKVIPLEDQKRSRDHRDIHEDVDEKLSEIYAVAALLAAMDRGFTPLPRTDELSSLSFV